MGISLQCHSCGWQRRPPSQALCDIMRDIHLRRCPNRPRVTMTESDSLPPPPDHQVRYTPRRKMHQAIRRANNTRPASRDPRHATWNTGSGVPIRICDMADSHLANVVRVILESTMAFITGGRLGKKFSNLDVNRVAADLFPAYPAIERERIARMRRFAAHGFDPFPTLPDGPQDRQGWDDERY